MRERVPTYLVAALIMALVTSTVPPFPETSALAQPGCQTFPQTGKTVCGKFLTYWQQHGGLAQQGYPISNSFGEVSDVNGQSYAVQYFERAVFELHPENAPPYDVLLSLLGNFAYKQKYPNGAPNQVANKNPGAVLFPQTGKTAGGIFLSYWRTHGALAQQGYPISEEFEEKSDLDGKPYTVQYFERAVFEKHPENAPPYDVLLSQLGTFRAKQKYGNPPQFPNTPAPTPPPASSCDLNWRVASSPNFGNGNNYLFGSAALSPSDLWTVGWATNNDIGETVALHWDGASWTRFPTPNIGARYNYLVEISALSASDIWAVGYAGDQDGGVARTLITHWNGTSWSLVGTPNPGRSSNYLEGLIALAPNNAWAAGHFYTGSAWRTLFLHWDGTSWTPVSSPNLGPSDNFLYDVRAVSPSDIWAAGWYNSGSGFRTLIEHWDGTAWNVVPSPNVGTENSQLWKLAVVSMSDIWAAGHSMSGGVYKTLALHWNGTTWSVVPSPNVGASNNTFEVIAAASSNDVWASGAYRNGAVDQTLAERWNGTAWTVVSSPNVGTTLSTLRGSISIISPTDVWATGYYSHGAQTQTLVEHYSNSPPCP